MRDAMTPEQMDRWEAAYRLGLWGQGWKQAAQLTAATVNAALLTMAAAAGVELTEDQLLPPSAFEPDTGPQTANRRRPPTAGRRLDPVEAELMMRARFAGV